MIPEFTERTGINVEVERLAVPLFVQRADLELASGGDTYDLMHTMYIMSGKWIGAGWCTDLTPFLEDASASEGVDFDDFLPRAIEPFRRDAATYSLPWVTDWGMMAYRQDIFDQHGIAAPPATFDELIDVVQRIHSEEVAGYMGRGQPIASQSVATWPTYLHGYGGDFFTNVPDDMTPLLDSDAAIQATETYGGLLRDFAPAAAVNYSDNDALNSMQQGRAALWIDAFVLFPPLRDPAASTIADTVRFAPVPQGPAGRFPIFASHGTHIPANAKNKEAAWEMLKWMTSKEMQERLAFEFNYPQVTRLSLLSDPRYSELYTWGGIDLGQAMTQASDDSTKMAYRTIPEFSAVGDRVGIAIQEYITNQKDATLTMQDAQRDVIAILRGAGYDING